MPTPSPDRLPRLHEHLVAGKTNWGRHYYCPDQRRAGRLLIPIIVLSSMYVRCVTVAYVGYVAQTSFGCIVSESCARALFLGHLFLFLQVASVKFWVKVTWPEFLSRHIVAFPISSCPPAILVLRVVSRPRKNVFLEYPSPSRFNRARFSVVVNSGWMGLERLCKVSLSFSQALLVM